MKQTMGQFSCGLDEATIISFVERMAPRCQECSCAKLKICVERCCATNPIHCWECEKDSHFLHRTNDLKMLFVGNQHFSSVEGCYLLDLNNMVKSMNYQKLISTQIIQSQQ